MSNIRKNLEEIRSTLKDNVTLIAVSKTKSVEEIMEAYKEGIRDFGENKVQELEEKYELLPKDIRWHLIGGLQTNKVRKVIGKTYLIQSLDRESLALEINKRAEKTGILVDTLIEVNIGEESQKAGILTDDLEEFVTLLKDLKHIRVRGLMAIIPQGSEEENRKYFKKMYELFQKLSQVRQERFTMEVLSMGMSMDYVTAMEEGSNMIRVGTGIFGARNYTI
ncbi:MAG TPA: YggS family pyridoxal phosphate-dependent enzyme [Proteiniclasticum sp.]|uniref:YggS family pyridoxal phosphate-dependent enzyme n=1 Tax=Proteiniclasticum sp. TaxID=2053595 RepID=UPI000E8EADE0|nr:YggS family pyridoxal phosphate-dependent enzyme [Proteiniclasticum sp.]HBW12860.1 YggS family pyridoxal phosphate-dependent enzyme [Proteiniclasticum sp.]